MRTLAGIFFSLVGCLASLASAAPLAPNRDVLFASREVLSAELKAPFAELFAKKNDWATAKKLVVAGQLIVDGRSIPVDVRLRGWSTLGICAFPKLMLKFKKGAADGTVFAGLKKLDLNTHCDPQGSMKDYFKPMLLPHREGLAYRWAKILGVDAYSVRLAQMQYHDTNDASFSVTAPAFFLEHLSSVLKRNQATEIRPAKTEFDPRGSDNPKVKYVWKSLEDAPALNREQLARVALFEALIGNSDWRMNANEIWNSKVIELPGGEWLTLPMDFNFSSLAQGYAASYQNWEYEAYTAWPRASADVRRKIYAEFLAAKPELVASVSELGDDLAGRKAALEIIETRLQEFAETP